MEFIGGIERFPPRFILYSDVFAAIWLKAAPKSTPTN